MKLSEFMIECERRAYLATGNPMHVWNAYATTRAKRIDVPEWILRYLDKASWGIREMAGDDVPRKDLAPRIARSLDLVRDGAGTPFDYDNRWWAYGRKVREFRKRGDQLDHARRFAAEFFEVSVSTIMRGARIYDDAFPDGDDEFVIEEDDLPAIAD